MCSMDIRFPLSDLFHQEKCSCNCSKHTDNPFVWPYEMTYGPRKGGKLRNITMHNIFWANQKTESTVCHWRCEHASFDFAHLLEHWTSFQAFC